ncbi:MAG: ABC transporter substrate-binding protein, partial [Nitrososphaeraceae archaeon]
IDKKFTSITSTAIICILVIVGSVFVISIYAEEQPEPTKGGTLVIATVGEDPILNPGIDIGAIRSSKIFSSLLQYDLNLNPKPDLAESWDVSDNGTIWTFHLVKNATFHDGVPVTSDDVKFTIEQVVIPYHPLGQLIWDPLKSIETPDKYTVVIKLERPWSPLIYLLDMGEGGAPVLPKHLYEGTDIPNNPYNSKPIGSGPFKFVKWEKGNQLVLERNDKYFRAGLPYLDKIIFRVMPDPTTIALGLENGEVNYAPEGISISDTKRFRTLQNINSTFSGQEAYGSTISLVSNLDDPVLGKLKVRQAIAHAIDKDLISKIVYLGQQKEAVSPVSSSVAWAFNPNVTKYEYDSEKANRLLDEAGYTKGPDGKRFTLTLHYYPGSADDLKVAEIVREQLRNVGIDIRIISLDQTAYGEIVSRNRDFQLTLESWTSGPDPTMQLGQIFHSKQAKVIGGNGANYSNPKVDQLFDTATYETNAQKKAELLYEIQDMVVRDLPFIWLIEENPPAAYTKDFEGLPSTPLIPTERMERVWWTGEGEVGEE